MAIHKRNKDHLGSTDDGPNIEGTKTYTATADITTAADIGPAPSAVEHSVLLQAVISTNTAMKFTMQMETTPGDERISFYLPANGSVVFVPRYPIKLGTKGKKWQAISDTVGDVTIHITTTIKHT